MVDVVLDDDLQELGDVGVESRLEQQVVVVPVVALGHFAAQPIVLPHEDRVDRAVEDRGISALEPGDEQLCFALGCVERRSQ